VARFTQIFLLAFSPGGKPPRPPGLASLGRSYQPSFRTSGSLHPDLPISLLSWGETPQTPRARFARCVRISLPSGPVACFSQIFLLAFSPGGEPPRPPGLSSLGRSYQLSFLTGGSLHSDLPISLLSWGGNPQTPRARCARTATL
jgi:hypothetical protein